MNFELTNKAFEQAPVGIHLARLFSMVDLGTQKSEYKGEETKRRQIHFTWELPNELREDGKPFIISKFYTQSIGEKANLTKDLTSWLGKAPVPPTTPEENAAFVENVFKPLLGKGCQVVVTENEKGNRNVATVTGLPKGSSLEGEPFNSLVYFSLDDFNEEVFDNLSQFLKGKVEASPEYAVLMGGEAVTQTQEADEEIPF